MKAKVVLFLLAFVAIMVNAQDRIQLTVNRSTKDIVLADTQAAKKLMSLLEESHISVRISDYGGFEKVGALPWSLPTENRQMTTSPGDVMLYQGDNIVIFYGENSWSYTPLGRIEGASADELRSFLSGSSIEATLSVGNSGVADIEAESESEPVIYNLQGVRVRLTGGSISDLPKGMYIINGKKRLI